MTNLISVMQQTLLLRSRAYLSGRITREEYLNYCEDIMAQGMRMERILFASMRRAPDSALREMAEIIVTELTQ